MKKLAFIIGICLCAVVSVSFTPKLPTTNQIEGRSFLDEDCTVTTPDGKTFRYKNFVKIVGDIRFDSYDVLKVHLVDYQAPTVTNIRIVDYRPSQCGFVHLVDYVGSTVTLVCLVDYITSDVLLVHIVD